MSTGRYFETGITAWLVKRHSLIHCKSPPVTPVCQFSVKCVLCSCKASQWCRFHLWIIEGLDILHEPHWLKYWEGARAPRAPWSRHHCLEWPRIHEMCLFSAILATSVNFHITLACCVVTVAYLCSFFFSQTAPLDHFSRFIAQPICFRARRAILGG